MVPVSCLCCIVKKKRSCTFIVIDETCPHCPPTNLAQRLQSEPFETKNGSKKIDSISKKRNLARAMRVRFTKRDTISESEFVLREKSYEISSTPLYAWHLKKKKKMKKKNSKMENLFPLDSIVVL